MPNPVSKFVVLGEASESDEEETSNIPDLNTFVNQCVMPIVVGEASESDPDSDDYYNVAEAFADKNKKKKPSATPKYNSLLHKKLRENNFKLKVSLDKFVRGQFEGVRNSVSAVNQSLLTSQVQLQEAAMNLRRSSVFTARINRILPTIDANLFLSNLNTNALKPRTGGN